MKKIIILIAVTIVLIIIIGLGAMSSIFLGYQKSVAQTVSADSSATVQIPVASPNREAIESIIKDYLLSNPEIMIEVQNALKTKQDAELRENQRNVIAADKDKIFNGPGVTVLGNPNGDVTIVEFYDYNCGYCKRALPDMDALLKSDPNVRFIIKGIPILGPDSMRIHTVAQAFKALIPEKYPEFHRALLGVQGRTTEQMAIDVAVKQGANEIELRERMKASDIEKTLRAKYDLANKLNITGTPTYIIGDEIVPGAIGINGLAEKISHLRAAKS